MKPAVVLLGLVLLLDATFAAEESCVGRCGSFNQRSKCQCDSMCVYYGSCCQDFDTVCPKKLARGDTFEEAEEMTTVSGIVTTPTTPTPTRRPTKAPPSPAPSTTPGPTAPVDSDAAPCSGQPFDAFLQLKNGSIYAFRGLYFFELDEKSVLPGYPKLIQDVWGMPGPIDAAFTRINCQGNSYIFKGKKYWRFDGDVLNEDFPRDISVGFDGIPNDIDAAFAIPAPSHSGREKAYFFKGDQYYQYDFKQQPSHEECVQMNRASPSVLFTQYTSLFCDQSWSDLFGDLFGSSVSTYSSSPRLTSRDWHGIRAPIDAAMVGRVYLSPKPTSAPKPQRRRNNRRRKPTRKQRKRLSRHVFDDLWSYDDWFDYTPDYTDYSYTDRTATDDHKSTPVQNVYFFKRDKYYRVDLQTKRVDSTIPRYPRSIAKYWLGCTQEETPDVSRAEKR